MIKDSVKNIVIPFSICVLMALALYPDSSLNPETYSTEGLELNYNISEDLAMVNQDHAVKHNLFTPHLGKSFEGFKSRILSKVTALTVIQWINHSKNRNINNLKINIV